MDELFNQLYAASQQQAQPEVEMDEVEKLASQLQDLGIDLDSVNSTEELLKIAEDLVQEAGGEEGSSDSGKDEEDKEKTSEFQEKVAEADFLGRVQAHAFAEELEKMGGMQSPDNLEALAAEAVDELATIKAAEMLGINLDEMTW